MKLITIEDIDQIASDLKDQLCTATDPQTREAFELEIYNYLKEALDPWRTILKPVEIIEVSAVDFDEFIYENFFDNIYNGIKDGAVEAYEDYRENLNEDDYMRLGNAFAAAQVRKTHKHYSNELKKIIESVKQ
jgi:hypothetical protein